MRFRGNEMMIRGDIQEQQETAAQAAGFIAIPAASVPSLPRPALLGGLLLLTNP
ncbi:hypothetical protein V1291_001542 [Nitrobacteraceae bacterium AZCC 1564]